ncbi:P-loop containing nucleoside triphosphate hydrolase protein [Tribonema minus]|uniref:P-loop containing nucleoside triphosphate hydrolase protein n=1 Tax=Tribonema minus TaxID=303371 RepID=A0A835YJH1_9STRA|nr:P-loop containing nucleoside triphosphate hydrolase protein [Tribonema minus]
MVDESAWDDAAAKLAANLRIQPERASADMRARIFHWYLPVMFWLLQVRTPGTCTIVGVSAPQGCGKTTLTQSLVALLGARGVRAVALSLDDFYLAAADQDALAARSADNPLLQSRGNAGTHDVALCVDTLRALKAAAAAAAAAAPGGAEVAVPRYDKSARGGRGDRVPRSEWSVAKGGVDVVLLEGWMLGFQPLEEGSALLQRSAGLPQVNEALAAYGAIHALVDAWVVVKVRDLACVRRWRKQAEAAMVRRGAAGMSPAEVDAFVDRFVPAYLAYLPRLYTEGPDGGRGKPLLSVTLDKARRPIPDAEN